MSAFGSAFKYEDSQEFNGTHSIVVGLSLGCGLRSRLVQPAHPLLLNHCVEMSLSRRRTVVIVRGQINATFKVSM
jgi:hypothetical protein